MKKLVGLGALLAVSSVGAVTKAEIQELKDRLEELEFQSYENTTRVSGTIENRFFSYSQKDDKTTTEADEFKKMDRFMTILDLDVAANPTPKLQAYVRFSMQKYWNRQSVKPVSDSGDGTRNGADTFGDLRAGGQPGSSIPYVSRAFINYNFAPSWSFTAGRLPTVGGAPKEYLTGSTEGGAYHTLAFSGMMDGMALSKSHGFKDGSKLDVKLVYTPWGYYDNVGHNIGSTPEVKDTAGNDVTPNDTVYSLILDYQKDGMKIARNAKFLYQYVKFDEVALGLPTQSSLRVTTDKHILSTDLKGVWGSKFDFSLAFAHIKTKSEGTFAGVGGAFCKSTNTESCDVSGEMLTFVTKYNFSPKAAIGVQYMDHGKKAFAFDIEQTGYEFFQTPGSKATKLFGYYKHNDFLTTAVSFTHSKISSQAAAVNLIGEVSDADKTVQGVDFRFIAKF